jgi:hypothetical protein
VLVERTRLEESMQGFKGGGRTCSSCHRRRVWVCFSRVRFWGRKMDYPRRGGRARGVSAHARLKAFVRAVRARVIGGALGSTSAGNVSSMHQASYPPQV